MTRVNGVIYANPVVNFEIKVTPHHHARLSNYTEHEHVFDRCRTADGPSAVFCLLAVILAQFLGSYCPIEGHLNLHTYLIAAQVGAALQNVSFHYKDGRTLFHSANDFRISAATFRAREAEKTGPVQLFAEYRVLRGMSRAEWYIVWPS